METDGILINRIWQPLHMLSWTGAAMEFMYTKKDFVRVQRGMTAGRWSPVCFLINGFVGRQLKDLTDIEKEYISKLIKEFTQIEFVNDLEESFKDNLEYPPFSLVDNWDGKCDLRTRWARYIHDTEPKLRV